MQTTELNTLHYVEKLTQNGHKPRRELQEKDFGETCS